MVFLLCTDRGSWCSDWCQSLQSCFAFLLSLFLSLNSDRNNLSGPIPDELFNLVDLELLDLDNNMLTGTISPRFANLKQLFFVTIGNNRFGGQPMPEAFANIPSLCE